MNSVLVILSTYNGEKYLYEQLDSILKQREVSLTLLIRDDGSTDDTLAILEKYATLYPGKIVYHAGQNLGYQHSFTALLKIVSEEYRNFDFYAFADQDDVWLEDKMTRAAIKLKGEDVNHTALLYCSNTYLVDESLNLIKTGWKKQEVKITKERATIQSFGVGCTMVFNLQAIDIYVSHIPSYFPSHDFLMYQLCAFCGKIVYDEEAHIYYRQHTQNQLGLPNTKNRWLNRLRHKGRIKEHRLEHQCYHFLESYKDLLKPDDIYTLCKIAFYRRTFLTRCNLIFDSKIKYIGIERNAFFLLKIICGGV